MTSDARAEILSLGSRWAQAEQSADTTTLDQIAAAGFRLVGPFGFVLDKAQWLDRYRAGGLVPTSLVWDEVEVRDFGQTAIAIGRQSQQATYQGRPADGRFRVSHVFVRDGGDWALASMHLSLATPPAAAAEAGSST